MTLFPKLAPLALVAALSVGTLGTAAAAQYTSLDTEASSVSFGYSQMNVKMDGSFGEMRANEFVFDPQQPQASKVAIEITLGSIDAGYEEANTELEKEEWLALNAYPVASFTSDSVESLGEGRYQVSGVLSIKGNAKPVTVPFSFKEDGDSGIFDGSFTFQRADFGIGEGQWKDFSIVANDVEIKFHMVANP